MGSARTYYERLGVEPSASPSEIRAAYRKLARRYHPDVSNGKASAAMAAVNEAWRVLGDPERRAEYDATLVPREPPRPSAARGRPPTAPPATAPDATRDSRPSWWNEPLTDDPNLDVPITDGRTVQALGILVALAGALALAGILALFAYAILWAG